MMVLFLLWEGHEGALPLWEGAPVTDAELDRQRKLLQEAFTAGWQAALAVRVTSPGVLAVIESCFDLWLEEEVDERGVLGLPFKRRYDLPGPNRVRAALSRMSAPQPVLPGPAQLPRRRQGRGRPGDVLPPAQRAAPKSESYDESSRDEGKVRTGS